jgi:hypothetical protein
MSRYSTPKCSGRFWTNTFPALHFCSFRFSSSSSEEHLACKHGRLLNYQIASPLQVANGPMRDFLSNNTARPSTAVPGHWLLKLPSPTAQISIRRFRERPDCSADDGSILAKLRNDPIEKGWREINGSDEGEVTGLLDGPCCTIVRGDGGRELWLFFAREASDVFVVDDFRFHEDGLEGGSIFLDPIVYAQGDVEVRPSPDSIQPAHLLICSEHGHDLSCVSAGTWKACPVQFKPTQETSSRWELLTDAVVEKLAWKFGRRVVMRPGLTTLR